MSRPADKPAAPIRPAYLALLALSLGALALTRIDWSRPVPPPTDAELPAMRPLAQPHDGFVGSAACRECHEDQHASWFRSWHRTMTQEVTPDRFLGRLNVTNLAFPDTDRRFTLFERDGQVWYRPSHPPDHRFRHLPSRDEYPIVLSTGSHHQQMYWYPIGAARNLAIVPVVYLKEAERWVPRKSVFLRPPSSRYDAEAARWNSACLECHTTGPLPNPGPDPLRRNLFETQVAEFGITCEACHGQGRNHVALHRQPEGSDHSSLVDRIVDPSALDHRRASQICGACHSISTPIGDRARRPYHDPGTDLTRHYALTDPPRKKIQALLEERPETYRRPEDVDPDYDGRFWWDGMARISGREFSNLRQSACFTRGQMSCLSCHSLHQSRGDQRSPAEWADDQLRPGHDGDRACLQCHSADEYATTDHTHHRADSTGSRCMNCHMPHTTYGLLKAIRSHTISSPRIEETLDAGRPTACNLCHLDKTLQWTGRHLADWYKQPEPELPPKHLTISTAALLALEGDAAQRALIAWAMAWQPAVETSGAGDWAPAYLSRLLQDPYDAVRYIAGRSLAQQPGFDDLQYDFLADQAALARAAEESFSQWAHRRHRASETVLIRGDGTLDQKRFEEHYRQRNDRRIYLME